MPLILQKEVLVTTSALVLYGVLQERVMTRGFGQHHELFPHSSFLVLCNRLLTVLVLVLHSAAAGHSFIPVAPLRSYCLVSASNMVSTLCQYEALKYVSFVAQTLAKTAKALPVVLWGTLVGGKHYSGRQYAHALLVTGGCCFFVLGGDVAAGSAARAGSVGAYVAGSLLLLTYLAADGWTSTQQEALFKTHATPIREQLLFTTAFSSVYSLVVCVAGGQLGPALHFLRRHPDAALAVLTLSLASTVIQVCISTVLQRHGALMFALMMTSRQCISVLLSTLLFGHTLHISQWVGISVVFAALYHQRSGGGSKQGGQQQQQQLQQRSRQAAVAAGQRMPHTRLSVAGASQQQHIEAAQVESSRQASYSSSMVFRGNSAGDRDLAAMQGDAATVPGTSMQTPLGGAAADRGPSLPPLPHSPVSYDHTGPSSVTDHPNCVAVADVHPGQHILQRPAAGSHHQQQVQAVLQQQQMALKGGVVEAALAQPLLSIQQQPQCAPPLPRPPAVLTVQRKQRLDMMTLWSRGAGRAMVDPTTAIAIEHREK